MRQIDDLDELARPYANALVTTLKNEGKLSSPPVESAFKHVPRHPFIDHFFLLAAITSGEVALLDPGSDPRANLDGMDDQENAERNGINPH